MQNVTLTVNGTKLVIEVDLEKRIGPSKTGKTMLIASTQGNAPVDGHPGVRVGVNVFRAEEKIY